MSPSKERKGGKPAKSASAGGEPATAQVKSWASGKAGQAQLDGSRLGDKVKVRLLRHAVRMYEANTRAGTHCTKTRGETNYSERKPYKQKGTGNARRGDFNSPLLRGGGVIFGPRPRDYSYSLPRRALREALRTALHGKLRDGEVAHLSSKGFDAPATKAAAAALAGLGCTTGRAVIVLPEANDNVYKSFRNIRGVSVVRASDLNAHNVLAHNLLVLVDGAWDALVARVGGTEDAS